MKTLSALFIALALTTSVEASLKLGESMPKLDPAIAKMKGVDGKTHDLTALGGKEGTLVIFSCNHCPYVKAWEDRIAELGNAYVGKLAVIQINSNDPKAAEEDSFENMVKRSKEKGFKFPYVVDETSKVARAFGATKTPEFYLFNKEGKLAYKGAIDDDHRAGKQKQTFLKNAIDNMLAGKDIKPAETKAVGCGIKFRSES